MSNEFNELIESFTNCYSEEEIACSTSRDWNKYAENHGKTSKEKNEIINCLHKLSKKYRVKYKTDDTHLECNEKKALLIKSVCNTISGLNDFVDYKVFKKENTDDMRYRLEIFKESLENNHQLRTAILDTLKQLGYNNICKHGDYPFFTFFLISLSFCEVEYIHYNIKDERKLLKSFLEYIDKTGKPIEDREINKKLEIYKNILYYRSKDKYISEYVSDKWQMNYTTFAKIYRKIFILSKHSLK